MLARGSKGVDVKELQQNLTKLGFNIGTADGIFGNKTEDAVLKFQQKYGLAIDGVVGPQTQAKILALIASASKQVSQVCGSLSGRTFIIAAGHGAGGDPGAVDGINPTEGDTLYTLEKDINLLFALEHKQRLEAQGAKVIWIVQSVDYSKQPALINQKYPGAVLFISWHNNAGDAKASGFEDLSYGQSSRAWRLAEMIRDEVKAVGIPLHGKGTWERPGLWLLKKTGIPTLIIEAGFITNPGEEARLHDPAYRSRIVDAVMVAMLKYYSK